MIAVALVRKGSLGYPSPTCHHPRSTEIQVVRPARAIHPAIASARNQSGMSSRLGR
jgi:hypothetical protein